MSMNITTSHLKEPNHLDILWAYLKASCSQNAGVACLSLQKFERKGQQEILMFLDLNQAQCKQLSDAQTDPLYIWKCRTWRLKASNFWQCTSFVTRALFRDLQDLSWLSSLFRESQTQLCYVSESTLAAGLFWFRCIMRECLIGAVLGVLVKYLVSLSVLFISGSF